MISDVHKEYCFFLSTYTFSLFSSPESVAERQKYAFGNKNSDVTYDSETIIVNSKAKGWLHWHKFTVESTCFCKLAGFSQLQRSAERKQGTYYLAQQTRPKKVSREPTRQKKSSNVKVHAPFELLERNYTRKHRTTCCAFNLKSDCSNIRIPRNFWCPLPSFDTTAT